MKGDDLAQTTHPVTGRTRDAVLWLDKLAWRLARHWLAGVNLAVFLYVGLPVLAPLLMNAGLSGPAKVLYFLYRPACHQRPERSYFIGGPQVVYSADELRVAGLDPLAREELGTPQIGYKVAFCERDVAMYGSLLAAGLLYGLLRRRWRVRPLPILLYGLFLLPLAVDGTLQLLGVYESTWLARTLTGLFFGLGSVWFAYPYLQQGFDDVRRTVNARLHLE